MAYPVYFQGAGGTGILEREEKMKGFNKWISPHGRM